MTDDDAPWRPPRPRAGSRAGSPPSADDARSDSAHVDAAHVPATHVPAASTAAAPARDLARSRRPRPPGARRQRASPRRRLATGYLAMALATVLVTGTAVAAMPTYDDDGPWDGLSVDDLRAAPGAAAWTLDLADVLAPDAPRRCLHFWPSAAVDGLVAVSTSVDLDFGDSLGSPACRSYAAQATTSRIALVDADSGALRWVHDLADEVPDTDALSIPATQVVPSAGRVLVQTQTTGATVLAALDVGDGSLVESTRGRRDLPSVSIDTRGPLQLRTFTGSGGGVDRYQLVDASHLAAPVWEGTADAGTTPALLDGGALVAVDGASVFVDGRTGDVRAFDVSPDVLAVPPGGPPGPSAGSAADRPAVAYAVERSRASGTLSAVDDDGSPLWSLPTSSRRITVTPTCLVAVTHRDTTAQCVDRRDGRVRWTTDLGVPLSVVAVPGQRSDDVYLVVQRPGGTRLLALDGHDGSTRFSATVGVLDEVVAASRSVLYLQIDDTRSRGTGVTAIDLVDGHELWSSSSAGSVGFWGGHLVEVDDRGVARRLVDDNRVGATS